MIANEKLSLEEIQTGNSKTVWLKGIIDEDTNFEPLRNRGVLRLNFSGVKSINSCGIRSWVNFLKDSGNSEIIFEACPPLIVRQMNMVPSFVAGAKVESVFIPYVCLNCDAEANMLVTLDSVRAGKVPLKKNCEVCKKGEMEFDGQPKQYFAFAK